MSGVYLAWVGSQITTLSALLKTPYGQVLTAKILLAHVILTILLLVTLPIDYLEDTFWQNRAWYLSINWPLGGTAVLLGAVLRRMGLRRRPEPTPGAASEEAWSPE